MTKEELLLALKEALAFEEEGTRFYSTEAAKAESPLAREALKELAAMEVDHAERIKTAYTNIENTGQLSGDELKAGDPPDALAGIWERIKDEIASLNLSEGAKFVTDEQVMEAASSLELRGLNMYKDKLAQATDEKSKQFFQFLVNEEQMHYNMLMQTKRHLAYPDTWFTAGSREEGGPIF
jgi:rubrerythrin